MKKALILLLSLVMLLTALPFACAEENDTRPAELFDLWDYGGESPVWIANATPIADGVLIAPITVQDLKADQLAVSDGEHAWEVAAVLVDENDCFTLLFYDMKGTAPRYGAWPLLSWGESVASSSCTVRFGDRMGSRIIRGVLDSEEITWKGQRFLLLSLTDPAPAGSPVLTSDGKLAGFVAAQWAEGVNRVAVMPADGIASSVSGLASLLTSLPDWGEAPEGLVLTADRNAVTIDWTNMVMPEKPEGSDVYIVILDTGNSYLTSFPAESQDRALTLVLTPGRFYIVGPVVSAGRPVTIPQSYVSVFIPNAGKLTDYGFKPVVTAIAAAPEEGLKEGEAPVPVTEVTEELLRSDRAYFYSHSTYEVTEEIEGSLLVTLTDPEGNNYRYQSGWLYAPEYMAEDIWYVKMSDSLTESLNLNGYPAGVYRMAFYVDGKLADEFEFELVK